MAMVWGVRRIFAIGVLFLAGLSGRVAAGDRPADRVDTRIAASYDEATRRLDGTVTQVWTNTTSDTVGELWFHLYWNAFSNTESTFLTESRGMLRQHAVQAGTATESEWGWQRVTSVLVGGEERAATLRYRQPEGGPPSDKTVFSIDLAEPLGPGETVDVTVHWESRVPRVRRRVGYKDDFLLVAHWFPKLGVYQQGRGWNCAEFHAHSEFFANFGTYDVELDLPARYDGRVFATGAMVAPSERRGERVIARFQAPSAAELDGLTALLDSGAFTQQSLAVLACTHLLNTGSADLVGLTSSGIEYVYVPGYG